MATPASAFQPRYYVLDTSVFVHNPDVLDAFAEHVRVIPEVVLEELDHLKRDRDPDVAANARHAARQLEAWTRNQSVDDLIPLPMGGFLQIQLNHHDAKMPPGWTVTKNDNRILQICLGLAHTVGHERVRLVSKDTILRIKARALDISAEDLRWDQSPSVNAAYAGWSTWTLRRSQLNTWMQLPEGHVWRMTAREIARHAWSLNEYIEVIGPGHSDLGYAQVQWQDNAPRLVRLPQAPPVAFDLKPRTQRQRWALDALLSPDIHVVTLAGAAGTGKTLLALAAGLELTAEQQRFDKLLICRPAVTMGEELGYLPGTELEKIQPYMRPIWDNLRMLFRHPPHRYRKLRADESIDANERVVQTVVDQYIDMQAVAYLRGRTISHQYLLIDEAQNLSPHQVRTILTRVGENTKVVLCGDPTQIDAAFLDVHSNGLVYAIEHLKDYTAAAHITFPVSDSVRSTTAQWVAEHF